MFKKPEVGLLFEVEAQFAVDSVVAAAVVLWL